MSLTQPLKKNIVFLRRTWEIKKSYQWFFLSNHTKYSWKNPQVNCPVNIRAAQIKTSTALKGLLRCIATTSRRKSLQVPSGISSTSFKVPFQEKWKFRANYAPEQDKSFPFDCRWYPESTWGCEVLWCCTSCQLCLSVSRGPKERKG